MTAGLNTVWGYTPSEPNMRRVLEALVHDRSLITDDLVRMRYEATLRPGWQESFESMFPPPRQQWVQAMALDENVLQAVAAEALILHGREDQVVPAEVSWRVHHLLQQSELHVIGDCGHSVQIERSARVCRQIRDFLTDRD